LQALRPNKMRYSQMMERFPSLHDERISLLNKKLISFDGDSYRITHTGRNVCPVVDYKPRVVVETISLAQGPDLMKKLGGVVPKFNGVKTDVKEIVVVKEEKGSKPVAQRMLEYIRQNPDCLMVDIRASIGTGQAGEAHLKSYIKSGRLVITVNRNDKKTYRLNEVIRKPSDAVTAAGSEDLETIAKEFSVAYTSNNCLMLSFTNAKSVELDASQVGTLLLFIQNIGLTERYKNDD